MRKFSKQVGLRKELPGLFTESISRYQFCCVQNCGFQFYISDERI